MKILVIGCGSIGKRHAGNAANAGCDVAVFDHDAAKAEGAAETVFDSLDAALAWQPDGVVVATPHKSHLEVASKALDVGAHVLVEKPISHDLENVDGLLAQAQKRGKQIFVVSNMRFHPAVSALRDALPRIGAVRYARAQYGNYLPNMRPDADYKKLYCAHKDQGGGVIKDVIHEVDYLSWFFGDVIAVNGNAAKLSDLEIDVEDFAHLITEHAGGVRCEIHMDYLKPFKRRGCEIVGEKGALLWQSEGKKPEKCTVRLFDTATDSWETVFETDDLDANAPYLDMMKSFVSAIENPENDSSLAKGYEGLAALKVVMAAYDSVEKEGRKVTVGG